MQNCTITGAGLMHLSLRNAWDDLRQTESCSSLSGFASLSFYTVPHFAFSENGFQGLNRPTLSLQRGTSAGREPTRLPRDRASRAGGRRAPGTNRFLATLRAAPASNPPSRAQQSGSRGHSAAWHRGAAPHRGSSTRWLPTESRPLGHGWGAPPLSGLSLSAALRP